jgi:CheY-like chemotaxis protein
VSLLGDSTYDISPGPALAPTEPGPRTRIAVIDDARDFLSLVSDVLESTCDVTVSTGEGLDLEWLVRIDPDLVLLDLRLREVEDQLTGMELLRLMRAHRVLRFVPVVVCSADIAQLNLNREALASDPRCWILRKPFGLDELERAVADALRGGAPTVATA